MIDEEKAKIELIMEQQGGRSGRRIEKQQMK
jgi:hypothetical protein